LPVAVANKVVVWTVLEAELVVVVTTAEVAELCAEEWVEEWEEE
jgi:hypothetical protein